ncbi:hypothetical protein GN330_17630 [Nitratireductor sp. CAU 1489]|uniref:Uncharacterized protein n=2 Tax=Nitratireductor arenosus TaxID=2682096 RepID=A0A844QHW5_9HYPH|nr:hypothetical protein [Nitratireductor arenosus]MVA99072.1 hypothetical protein [Nitratireductor arenosus]
MLRVFVGFALLALAAVAISAGGKLLGRSIVLAGHTEDTTPREIVIGNDVVVVPANAIRFERERRDGVAPNLHLYLRWPDMTGYRAAARDDFNHAGGRRAILFLSFEPRMMSRDMSGRYDPIYRALIDTTAGPGPGGLRVHAFSDKSGYANEQLLVGPRAGGAPFVARCLSGPVASELLAECERDIFVGEELSLTYRFPADLLADWRRLDAAVRSYAGTVVRSDADDAGASRQRFGRAG